MYIIISHPTVRTGQSALDANTGHSHARHRFITNHECLQCEEEKRFTSVFCYLFYPNYTLSAELASVHLMTLIILESQPFIHEFIIRLHPASHNPSAKLIIVTKMEHQPEIATYFSDSETHSPLPPSRSHNNKWNESK